MADPYADPALGARARSAADSFGWLLLIAMGFGAGAWCRAFKRLL